MGYFKISKILFVVIVNSFCVQAQKVLPFFGGGKSILVAFDSHGYYNLSTGLLYNLDGYIKPEVELRFFFGALEDVTTYDVVDRTKILEYSSSLFQAFNWSIAPCFSFPLDEDKRWLLVVKPKYNYAEIKATDIIVRFQREKEVSTTETRKGVSRSFGLSVGLYCKVLNDAYDGISLYLFTDNANFGKVIQGNRSGNVDTRYSLGFGAVYYFSFKKRS